MTRGRVLLLSALLLAGACGGRQSSGATTVDGRGSDESAQPAPEAVSTYDVEVPAGKVDIEQYAKQRDAVAQRTSKHGRSDARSERRDVKMTSYEKAMARPVEMGDPTVEGGESQLSAEQVESVMDVHLEAMYELCIYRELERRDALGTVTMDLAIRGRDGMILGTTIEPGRRLFKRCLEKHLNDVYFPTFGSPRMGVRYRFETGPPPAS